MDTAVGWANSTDPVFAPSVDFKVSLFSFFKIFVNNPFIVSNGMMV